MTPAGHIPRLTSPEPDTGVGIPLVSRLQSHDKAGTGYAGCYLLLDLLKTGHTTVFTQTHSGHCASSPLLQNLIGAVQRRGRSQWGRYLGCPIRSRGLSDGGTSLCTRFQSRKKAHAAQYRLHLARFVCIVHCFADETGNTFARRKIG